MMRIVGILAVSLTLGGCLSAAAPAISGAIGGSEMAKLGPPKQSEDVMGGGQYIEPWLSAAVKDASGQPLGSMQNPVRAEMPRGQHAYLQRLRCANGQAPQFSRVGNMGFGVFGSIVDAYEVTCAGSSPARTEIIMDMYFPGYVEARAVAGFTIVAP